MDKQLRIEVTTEISVLIHYRVSQINEKVYVNGYEYTRNGWKRTLRTIFHYFSETDTDGDCRSPVTTGVDQSIPIRSASCIASLLSDYYLEAGFDQISDLIRMHNVIFSHKPVNVAPDEVNVHAHLHTQMMSALTSQHINAYGPCWGKEIPLILLDDLLAPSRSVGETGRSGIYPNPPLWCCASGRTFR